jgi:ferredoxin
MAKPEIFYCYCGTCNGRIFTGTIRTLSNHIERDQNLLQMASHSPDIYDQIQDRIKKTEDTRQLMRAESQKTDRRYNGSDLL